MHLLHILVWYALEIHFFKQGNIRYGVMCCICCIHQLIQYILYVHEVESDSAVQILTALLLLCVTEWMYLSAENKQTWNVNIL